MKRRLSMVRSQCLFIVIIIALFFIVASGNKTITITTNNVTSVKSIQAVHLISKYNPKIVKTKIVDTFDEVIKYGKIAPIKFDGTMTGYGPDCEGCGGRVGCPPRQNVKNGNIYFYDQEYGKVNIVATDKRIPCGSMIKITNSTLGPEIIAIALDRGGAIKGTLMDFLTVSEKDSSKKIGRQRVTYEIVRWGW